MKKMKMKVLLALTLTTAVLAGCATQDTITKLEDAGSSFGAPMPKWMEAYAFNRSVNRLAQLPEYAGNYCFVAEEFDIGSTPQVLQQLIRWSDQFSAQQKIGQTISSTIASTFQANESKKPDGPEATRQYNAALAMISQATYSGARKEGDWWIKERVESRGAEPIIRYRVVALYIIPKEQLDRQIENKLKEIAKENPAMAAVVDAVTATVLAKGLDWTPSEPQRVSTAP
jgi:hypothetical protein